MNACEEQIRQIGGMMKSVYTLFCAKGQAGVVQPLTADERKYIERLKSQLGGFRSIKPQQCYKNAQRLKLFDDEGRLTYMEGYYLSEKLPVAVSHAWVTIGGKVVDVTVEALQGKDAGRKGETWQYFGVPISEELLRENALDTKMHSPVTENRRLAVKVWGNKLLATLR